MLATSISCSTSSGWGTIVSKISTMSASWSRTMYGTGTSRIGTKGTSTKGSSGRWSFPCAPGEMAASRQRPRCRTSQRTPAGEEESSVTSHPPSPLTPALWAIFCPRGSDAGPEFDSKQKNIFSKIFRVGAGTCPHSAHAMR